jgi:hypothetical protein
MKYKLFIRQYDITTNDYKVREEIVETNDIYHEIGKIYSTAFAEIKRIDYKKIDETKELEQEIERLNNINEEHRILNGELRKELQQKENIIKEAREYINENEDYFYNYPLVSRERLLEILNKGSDKE